VPAARLSDETHVSEFLKPSRSSRLRDMGRILNLAHRRTLARCEQHKDDIERAFLAKRSE
jgi:hypothetical protein